MNDPASRYVAFHMRLLASARRPVFEWAIQELGEIGSKIIGL
jgi:hypothetical protein